MAIPPAAIKKLKTNTKDYTQTAVIVLISYGVFKPQDIDKAIATVQSKDTWVVPSKLPNYDDSIQNDIQVGRETPEIVNIRNIISAHYGITVEDKKQEELVEENQELPKDISEQEINDEENKKSSSSVLTIFDPEKENKDKKNLDEEEIGETKQENVNEEDLVEEEIDERILRLLGLEHIFDIDYGTYLSLLKEKLISSRMTDSNLSAEEDELLREELKRVKGKVGRFKPKKNVKINVSNITGINLLNPTNKKQSDDKSPDEDDESLEKEKEKKESIFDGILNILKSITKTVDNIYGAISLGNTLLNNQLESDRKKNENLKRKGEEQRLETKKDGVLTKAKKILAPFESIFDRILKFIIFTILGRAFKLFMDWASDPENRKKLESVGRFLKDWWPALLGAWFLFATPLGAFTRTIIGTVAKLSLKLAKFAIPKLIKFVAANPKAAAAAAVIGGGAYLATKVTSQQDAAPVQAQNKAKIQTGKAIEVRGTDTGIDKSPSVGDMGPSTPYGLLQGVNTGGIIKPLIKGVSNGGNIFSGLVDKDTGETVSGAGPDTQFLPIENGGGAVLQRGEVVLQKGARERMIRQAGVDPLAYNIGSNANKPRKINADTLASSMGGLIGLSNGGEIGIAAHHLKQDESLSSLTPGINDFTRPGSSKWSKITTNTPIHSYIDSVGKPTIGWGSTYYDSILNGKKPVKSGDKITKGKADNILVANISGLSKEYSTKIPHWNKMSNNQRAGLLILGYNAPYGPIGAYPKLTKALQQGDIKSASQNIHREGPNAERIALERSLLMSGPINLKNLVGPKIVGEKKVGSGIPGIPPIFYNRQKKQGGGVIKMQSGGVVKLQGGGKFNPVPGIKMKANNLINKNLPHTIADYMEQQELSGIPTQPPTLEQIQKRKEEMKEKMVNTYLRFKNHLQSGGKVISTSTSSPKQQLSELLQMRANSLERQGRLSESYGLKAFGSDRIIKSTDGIYNPHSASDRRMFPIIGSPNIKGIAALQEGEGVVPRNVMDNIGEHNFNKLIAYFDNSRTSNAAKLGYTKPKINNIQPPIKSKGGIVPITLPPKTQSSGTVPTSSGGGTQVPPFSTVSAAGMSVRINNADIYGIVR